MGPTGPAISSQLLSKACVGPVAESYVSRENTGEQGAGAKAEIVSEIFPWISPRMPDNPALANGKATVTNWSGPTVKDVGVPIWPLGFAKEIVPVQDAAGSPAVEPATFTNVTEAVSLAPRPAGGET
jgi:hypothetical protein